MLGGLLLKHQNATIKIGQSRLRLLVFEDKHLFFFESIQDSLGFRLAGKAAVVLQLQILRIERVSIPCSRRASR